ncbi:4-carboxy-4-hydroxy-2-oxoadipate aldolase/oxaloacetate decarboxylase [Streptomyces sp. WAC 00631]|uniref:4-carboxy-4-hydroxy-2-oxoadipate aldolase/oxaloacetate decarboxylase n=1 Tax=Streptomyces sp. WAC 00631 TaxID=2203201 RepID=UPI000F78A209|nr:4-carboxy-4-hydroxy-2-oxoadipate aldolase/oxaloacetate decarboxylase [Streptomyces sp. WAC 00631]MCC5036710.1 4-carboxy-4-hydroxy-2-oxoadipate aldolase/oxaloacetate decarboxylase [Streptomyces sp. WAC 00631]
MSPEAAELGRAGVATVYEAYGRRGLIEESWDAVTPGRRTAGPACTVLCGPGDNRAVHEAMDVLRPGEILVVTLAEPEPVAVIGDLLATQAAVRGAAGLLVNAAVRDTAELAGLQMAIHARWRNARGAGKEHRGQVNVPVRVGGTLIEPGDPVVLDDDGATAVRAADVPEVVRAARARIAKEAALRARWQNGEISYDVYGLRAQDSEGSVTA